MATTTTATARARRRWRTISLRGLMLLIFLLAVWLGWETNRARRQKHAIEVIQGAGGQFLFDDEVAPDGTNKPASRKGRPAWQKWLMRTLGGDYVRRPYWLAVGHGAKDSAGIVRPQPEFWRLLADLPDLASLHLDGCEVTDDNLAVIGKLRRLGFLELQGNRSITDTGLAELKNLTELIAIDLRGTAVTDDGIRYLTHCRHLAFLRVGQTAVSDRTLALLPNWPEMRALNLSSTLVTDQGMVHLRGLTNLIELTIADTRITDGGLAHVVNLNRLEILYMYATPTGDVGIARLSGLDRLQYLGLGCWATDESLPVLKRMKRLKVLDVGPHVSQAGINELKASLPSTQVSR